MNTFFFKIKFFSQKVPKKYNGGFTIVETLVAITVLMISIAGPLVVATKGLTSAVTSKDQMVASYLALESMEIIKSSRNNNPDLTTPEWMDIFDECTNRSLDKCDKDAFTTTHRLCTDSSDRPVMGCKISFDSNGYKNTTTSGDFKTPFYRYFVIQATDILDEKIVHVYVNWFEGSVPYQVHIVSNIVNARRKYMKSSPSQHKGYTLLFAVLIATLVLGVSVFILSVSTKQYQLAVSARESVYALYAADSALECIALALNNGGIDTSLTVNTEFYYRCSTHNNGVIKLESYIGTFNPSDSLTQNETQIFGSNATIYRAEEMDIELSESMCAKVNITKGPTADGKKLVIVNVRGYNSCDDSTPKKSVKTVERGLSLIIEYGGDIQ